MSDGIKIYSNLKGSVITEPGTPDPEKSQSLDWDVSHSFSGDDFFEVSSAQTSTEGLVSIGN